MTVEQILADIKSDRKKKVIFDSDTACEIDDQYSLAYALAAEKFDVIAAYAELVFDAKTPADEGVKQSYAETLRVMKAIHQEDRCPAFIGCPVRIDDQDGYVPVDSPASRHLVKTAMKSDEIIYVLCTGPVTNIASALLMEPAIAQKICVVWIGGVALETKHLYEANIRLDYRASQVLMNSGAPLVLLPACGEPGYGTIAIEIATDRLAGILSKETDACRFFRENLLPKASAYVFWDLAAPAALQIPEAFDFSVIPAPVLADDHAYAFDSSRHEIIYMTKIRPEMILEDALAHICLHP